VEHRADERRRSSLALDIAKGDREPAGRQFRNFEEIAADGATGDRIRGRLPPCARHRDSREQCALNIRSDLEFRVEPGFLQALHDSREIVETLFVDDLVTDDGADDRQPVPKPRARGREAKPAISISRRHRAEKSQSIAVLEDFRHVEREIRHHFESFLESPYDFRPTSYLPEDRADGHGIFGVKLAEPQEVTRIRGFL
jgi:hypothetical protein